jgi:arylsulfatase A-like enzyme
MTTKAWQDGRWHYVEYETGERELYDVVEDPWEMENRAGEAGVAEIETALRKRLHQLIGEPPGW